MFKILSTLQKRDASQTGATNRKLLFPLHTFTSIPLSPVNSKFSCFLFRKIQAVPTVFCIRYRMFHATLGFCERCFGSTFLETSLVGTDAQALVYVWRTSERLFCGAGEGSWDWAKGEDSVQPKKPSSDPVVWARGYGSLKGVQEESECRGWEGLFKRRYGCISYSQRRPEPFPSCLCSGWWRLTANVLKKGWAGEECCPEKLPCTFPPSPLSKPSRKKFKEIPLAPGRKTTLQLRSG